MQNCDQNLLGNLARVNATLTPISLSLQRHGFLKDFCNDSGQPSLPISGTGLYRILAQ